VDNSVEVFSIETLLVGFPPHIGYLLSQEALSVAMAAIIRGPSLKVRLRRVNLVNSFALGLV